MSEKAFWRAFVVAMAVVFLGPWLSPGPAWTAQPTPYQLAQTLLNPTPAAGDGFGTSVAALGGKVVVGTRGDDTMAADAGAVYVFDGATGSLLLTIASPTPAAGDGFGWAVAAFGNRIVVGEPGDDSNGTDNGVVYVFDATTGNLLLTIANPTPASFDLFGAAVAAVNGNILVGALNDNDEALVQQAGAAYLFDGQTGTLLLTIPNPNPVISAKFGTAVAGVGGNILVGAYDGCCGGSSSIPAGSAHLFDGQTGALLAAYQGLPPQNGDAFGAAVAAVGEDVLIGAFGDDTGGTDRGRVYRFDTSGGPPTSFLNPTPADFDGYGSAVAGVGNHLLAGAYLDDTAGTNGGAAYLINTSTGNLLATLLPPPPTFAAAFGFSVAASGFDIIIGAPGVEAVYVFVPAIQSLIDAVQSLPLKPGQKNAVTATLEAALDSLAKGNIKAVCVQLSAFIHQVEGLGQAGQLPASSVTSLVSLAEAIREVFGC